MFDLRNKVAIVAGGTSHIGRGIVYTLLKAGAEVVVPSRSITNIESLQKFCPSDSRDRLIPVMVDLTNESQTASFAGFIFKEYHQIDILVSGICCSWQGESLTSVQSEIWDRVFLKTSLANFTIVRHIVPMLDVNHGIYFHLNRQSADLPQAFSGLSAMSAAAQKAMVCTLSEELRDVGIRCYEIITGNIRPCIIMQEEDRTHYCPMEIGMYLMDLVLQRKESDQVIHRLISRTERQIA